MAEAESQEGVRPGGAPPASKRAVKALTREVLNEARLKQLGGPDVQCSVCRSTSSLGFHFARLPGVCAVISTERCDCKICS